MVGEDLPTLLDYVKGELGASLRDLFAGLGNLDLEDNFASFLWEGTIPATTTQQIRHTLGQIPRGRIILKHVGNSLVTDFDDVNSPWTKDFVYLRNNGANSVTLRVLYFR